MKIRALAPVAAALLALATPDASARRAKELDLQGAMPAACATPSEVRLVDIAGEPKSINAKAVQLGSSGAWFTQMDGGSAGLGILFGPLGTLASGRAVDRKTSEQAASLGGHPVKDPDEFLDLSRWASTGAGNGSVLEVDTHLHFVRPKKSTRIERRLVLDLRCAGWQGRYTWHFRSIAGTASSADEVAAATATWERDVRDAANALVDLAIRDAAGELAETGVAQVASWQLNPYFGKPINDSSLRGQRYGREILVGQGSTKSNFLFEFLRGVHVLDADQFEIKKLRD